jgi:hypothetical protein
MKTRSMGGSSILVFLPRYADLLSELNQPISAIHSSMHRRCGGKLGTKFSSLQ